MSNPAEGFAVCWHTLSTAGDGRQRVAVEPALSGGCAQRSCTCSIGAGNPIIFDNPSGAVAQLGERSVRNAEVTGSIPVGSTFPFNKVSIDPAPSREHEPNRP